MEDFANSLVDQSQAYLRKVRDECMNSPYRLLLRAGSLLGHSLACRREADCSETSGVRGPMAPCSHLKSFEDCFSTTRGP